MAIKLGLSTLLNASLLAISAQLCPFSRRPTKSPRGFDLVHDSGVEGRKMLRFLSSMISNQGGRTYSDPTANPPYINACGKTIARCNLKDAYWSPYQVLTYLASAGCGMRTGDLVGTGTLSSPSVDGDATSSCGCLAEMLAMEKDLPVIGDSVLSWLQDGDELSFEGRFRNGGFGGVSGRIVAAEKA